MIQLKPIKSRQDKRLYLKYINKFRKGYWSDAQDLSMLDVNYGLDQKIVCCLVLLNNKCIGMVEATPGNVYTTKIINIATIYIDKRYRNSGIAKYVYKYMQSSIPNDVEIALQIEERNFESNKDKFLDCGFTHYDKITLNSDDHRQYDEQTYVLFTKQHINKLKPINNSKIN